MQIAWGNKNNPHWDETFTYLMVNHIQNSPQSGSPFQFSVTTLQPAGTAPHFRYIWSTDRNAPILLKIGKFIFRCQIQGPEKVACLRANNHLADMRQDFRLLVIGFYRGGDAKHTHKLLFALRVKISIVPSVAPLH